jgi:thiol-disulfide isomerase/thioredoxin
MKLGNWFVGILVLCGIGFAEGALKVKVGQLAPPFSMPSLLDPHKRIRLMEFADSSRYAADPKFGKPVLIAFWNTTCAPCRVELQRLQKWTAKRPDIEFIPWLIEDTDPAAPLQWLRSIGIHEAGVLDKHAVKAAQYVVCKAKKCHVPALVSITPDQRVRLAKSGYDPSEPLEAMLDEVLPMVAVDESATGGSVTP